MNCLLLLTRTSQMRPSDRVGCGSSSDSPPTCELRLKTVLVVTVTSIVCETHAVCCTCSLRSQKTISSPLPRLPSYIRPVSHDLMCLTEMSRVSDVLRMPSGVASHVSLGEQLADGGWAGPRQEVDLPCLQQMAELDGPFSARRRKS